MLAKILKQGGNFLILDEPTNDLDLSSLRLLEEALASYGGCVLVVSHDRYFLNRVCTGILGFEGDGEIVYTPGDYDYHLEKRRAREAKNAPAVPPKPVAAPEAPKPKQPPKKLSWKEARELEGMEAAILAVEDRIAEIEALFGEPDFYTKHGSESAALQAALDEARAESARLYARWEELEAKRMELEQK